MAGQQHQRRGFAVDAKVNLLGFLGFRGSLLVDMEFDGVDFMVFDGVLVFFWACVVVPAGGSYV